MRREISYLQAAMQCSIYYINTNEIPSHFTTTVFSCERCDLLCSHSNGDIFTCENDMLFSRVKISCFRAKAHLVFHWCLYNKASSFQGLKKITGRCWLCCQVKLNRPLWLVCFVFPITVRGEIHPLSSLKLCLRMHRNKITFE